MGTFACHPSPEAVKQQVNKQATMESALQPLGRLATETALPAFAAVETAVEEAASSPEQIEIGLGMSLFAAGLIGVMVVVINIVARARVKKRQEEKARMWRLKAESNLPMRSEAVDWDRMQFVREGTPRSEAIGRPSQAEHNLEITDDVEVRYINTETKPPRGFDNAGGADAPPVMYSAEPGINSNGPLRGSPAGLMQPEWSDMSCIGAAELYRKQHLPPVIRSPAVGGPVVWQSTATAGA